MNTTFAAAIIAAAAVGLSACATGATETAAPTVPVATSAARTVPAWVSIEGRGVWQPYSQTPAPGGRIVRNLYGRGVDLSDLVGMCSLGPAAAQRGSDQTGFLTAAHCFREQAGPTPVALQTDAAGSIIPLAESTTSAGGENGVDPFAGTMEDAASIWTTAANATGKIAGTWDVAGVLTVDGVRELVKPGDPICYVGATTGIHCGGAVTVSGMQIRFRAPNESHGGDSGSSVFVVDQRTGAATLIGIFQGNVKGDDSTAIATFLDPEMKMLGAQALVDRSAAESVADDPRYSKAVVPAA
jgi:hypothetical protein